MERWRVRDIRRRIARMPGAGDTRHVGDLADGNPTEDRELVETVYEASHGLTCWETDFVEGLKLLADARGRGFRLTPTQRDKLKQIERERC